MANTLAFGVTLSLAPWLWERLYIIPLAGALLGIIVGSIQWFAIRPFRIPVLLWVAATMVGNGIGDWIVAANVLLQSQMGQLDLWGIAYANAVGGTAFGLLQWLVLRRLFYRAGWWVLANTFGRSVGSAVAVSLNLRLDLPFNAGAPVAGLVIGIATTVGLVLLKPRSPFGQATSRNA